ncbi:MAG TPA: POTRA domain-containing protein, partial [Candidatus Babeliaceae bacterium]|nr:POTRA domain-containing protein [Candidatus Babeliaceae bacterium]
MSRHTSCKGRSLISALFIALSLFLQSTQILAEDSQEISLMPEDEFNAITSTPSPSTVDNACEQNSEPSQTKVAPMIIHNIHIIGTSLKAAILAKLPPAYKPGSPFKPTKSGDLIRAVYSLGYFLPTISLKARNISPSEVDLYIIVQEKNKIEDVQLEGTYSVKKEDIEKELHLSEIKAATQEDLEHYAQEIRRVYALKDFHQAKVTPVLEPTQDGRSIARFCITEGPRAAVKRVFFKGNKTIPDKVLRSIIFTREEWLFSFFDKSGSYQPDAIEMDKRIIEQYYQSNGFLTARVVEAAVDLEPESCQASITFYIEEGELYFVKKVEAPGNNLLTEPQILAYIGIRPGELYSRERITEALKKLRLLWGEYGHIYADVDPIIQPNEQEKTVSISFVTELGPKVTVGR